MTTPEDDERRRYEEALKQRVGTVLGGKYTLESLLGAGGMAAVYRARHRNGNKVAVKMLHPEVAILPELRARFLREGYVANGIEHPGVVRVIDDDVTPDGAVFLVMDLLEGRTLGQLIDERGGTLAPTEIVPIALQILDVLVAAHARGIIHRDIKPENIFVLGDASVRLLDFGIARVAHAASATRTGHLMGTPAYMAPEQARGMVKQIDARTDLWAVGAVLFRALTGRQVHVADTPELTVVHAATRAAEPVLDLAPSIGIELANAIDRALVVEMASRWPDASAMREALNAATSSGLSELAQPVVSSSAVLDRTHPMTPVTPSGGLSAGTHPMAATPPGLTAHGTLSATAGGARSGALPERAGSRGSVVALGLLAAVILGGGALGLSRLSATEERATRANGVVAVEPAPPASASAAVLVVAPEETPAGTHASASALPFVSVSAAAEATGAPSAKPVKPALPTAPAKASASATGAAAQVAPTASAPNCSPPYTFDAAGTKQWKAECFAK